MYQRKAIYGSMYDGRRMLTNQWSLALVTRAPQGSITDHMRATLTAWGDTPKGEMEQLLAAYAAENRAASATDREHQPLPPTRPQNTIAIYTDGSYDRTTRDGGVGVVAVEGGTSADDLDAKPIIRIWKPVLATDNNDTEVAAILTSIIWARKRIPAARSIFVYTDSTYAQHFARHRPSKKLQCNKNP